MPEIACPKCGKRMAYEHTGDLPAFPFCSERCRLLDLGAWLDEELRISTPLPPGADHEEEETPE